MENKNPNTLESQATTQLPIAIQIVEQKERLNRLERFKELAEAAKPLQAYLQKYHDPHTQIGVIWDRVVVHQEVCSTPL